MKKQILLATTNLGKLKEIQFLLHSSHINNIHLLTLKDFPFIEDIEETESTFEGNALLKAQYYFQQTQIPVISDDSGLVIPAINNEPGIYSARYAGIPTNFQNNIDLVLQKMTNIIDRTAYFTTCSILFINPQLYTVSHGFCHGEIAQSPLGQEGFGYDPIFYLPQYQTTMANISFEEKQKISHRSASLAQILPIIKNFGIN